MPHFGIDDTLTLAREDPLDLAVDVQIYNRGLQEEGQEWKSLTQMSCLVTEI